MIISEIKYLYIIQDFLKVLFKNISRTSRRNLRRVIGAMTGIRTFEGNHIEMTGKIPVKIGLGSPGGILVGLLNPL